MAVRHFRNTVMIINAEALWSCGPRRHPLDLNKYLFDKWTLQTPSEVGFDLENGLSWSSSLQVAREPERMQHEVFTQEDVIVGKHSLTNTSDQGIYYLADMHPGIHSRYFDHAVLNEDEVRLQHFHDRVHAYLAEDVM